MKVASDKIEDGWWKNNNKGFRGKQNFSTQLENITCHMKDKSEEIKINSSLLDWMDNWYAE